MIIRHYAVNFKAHPIYMCHKHMYWYNQLGNYKKRIISLFSGEVFGGDLGNKLWETPRPQGLAHDYDLIWSNKR